MIGLNTFDPDFISKKCIDGKLKVQTIKIASRSDYIKNFMVYLLI